MTQLEMLKASAALCQPRHNIILERETLLSHIFKDKLFEAIIFEVLTRHQVKQLVDHRGLSV